MTTRAEMAALFVEAEATVAGLRAMGAEHVAGRMQRCMEERRDRDPGRRPWSCRAWCPWCSRALVARWSAGLAEWIGTGDVSVIRVPVAYVPGEVREAVRGFRRAWRNLRDRQGRRIGQRAWRRVEAAGMLGADGAIVLSVRHDGLTRGELLSVVRRRWPGVRLTTEAGLFPVNWSIEDRVALAVLRRDVEPLRVMVPAQRVRVLQPVRVLDPMPIIVP